MLGWLRNWWRGLRAGYQAARDARREMRTVPVQADVVEIMPDGAIRQRSFTPVEKCHAIRQAFHAQGQRLPEPTSRRKRGPEWQAN